jgi:hypothetical protein
MPTVNRRAVIAAVLINVAILSSMAAAKTRVAQVRHAAQALQVAPGSADARETTGLSLVSATRPSSAIR